MRKMIAVWGSPVSGKTSFSIKLGQEIYSRTKKTVILFHTDTRTPALAVLFPRKKDDAVNSAGVPLNRTDISPEEVTAQIITTKDMKDIGYFGFGAGENKYTYPEPTEDKVRALLNALKSLADYVIVDCTIDHGDAVSGMALQEADTVFRLCTPDLKSMAYFSSQLPLYADPVWRTAEHIKILNIPDADLYMPVEDAKVHFQNITDTLPFSRALKQQMLSGTLPEMLKDRKYRAKVAKMSEMVLQR